VPYTAALRMQKQSAVHDLQTLVLSFHSLIAIETVEEERIRSMVREVARNLNLPLFDWSLTTGISRTLGIHIEGTTEPLSLLRKIDEIHETDSIYLLKDFAPHLTNPAICRALRELAIFTT